MFDVDQFAEVVVKPALWDVGMYSLAAEQLLVGTAAVESLLGTYLVQVKGPALGVFQMEPATHKDIWDHYLLYRRELKNTITTMCPATEWTEDGRPNADCLVTDLKYATIMARLLYRRVKFPLPYAHDWYGMGRYWKENYNTVLGKGTIKKFVRASEDCGVIPYYNSRR